MEGQVAPMQSPAPAQSGGSSIQSNHILMVVLGGIVLGFAFGIGTILANKAMKKNVAIVPSDSMSSANGGQGVMYPPRQQQMPQRPMYPPQVQGYGSGYGNGFMRFDGKIESENTENWWGNKLPNSLRDEMLTNVPD